MLLTQIPLLDAVSEVIMGPVVAAVVVGKKRWPLPAECF
jgi:hypothetical protein